MFKNKKILLLSLLLFPILVNAKNEALDSFIPGIPSSMAIFMELFVSIHMSVFVLKPLSKIISKDDSNKTFWTLFIIRAVILIIFDLFITTSIALVDFFMVFIGAFLIVPIATVINKKKNGESILEGIKPIVNSSSVSEPLKCSNCGEILNSNDNFCTSCGKKVNQSESVEKQVEKVRVLPSNFDSMYQLNEDKLLETFLNKELKKANISETKLIPLEILKRKKIFNLIFSGLLFIYLSMIFFHFPIMTYFLGLVLLIGFFIATRRYNFMKYLKKQVKARPNEKISNIVMSVKNSFVEDNSKLLFLSTILLAIGLPLIIFQSPKIIYEHVEGGYAVRFYAFGLSNFKTVNIPSEYKGEKVVSLRGNAFSNMPFLESAVLPDTIKEIRGQAFKNDISLVSVKLPSNLEYLGGGSFYNCSTLKSINLPNTITFIGGETFYNATSLDEVVLPPNITEIRGDTFEYCSSLKSINIPDSVTRIGGHAFYSCSNLKEVTLTENSKLQEIGSSAFRLCDSLYEITIPKNTIVNMRAFKESPTVVKRFGLTDEENDEYSFNNSFDYNYDY